METDSDNVQIEQLLLTIKECYVFKIPPLQTASGHRAESWGIENPMFTGLLKMFQKDDFLRIVIYRYKDEKSTMTSDDNLVQFAECPIHIAPKENVVAFVDGVADSSRYFVLRIKDPKSSRSVSIGIGFRERDIALDFKNALNEYVRYVDRMSIAAEMKRQSEELNEIPTDDGHTKSMRDMSIKEGEKIHIAVKGASSGSSSRKAHSSTTGGALKLRPPPAPGSVVQPGQALLKDRSAKQGDDDNTDPDGFGDFQTLSLSLSTPPPHSHSSAAMATPAQPFDVFNSFGQASVSNADVDAEDDCDWGDFSSST